MSFGAKRAFWHVWCLAFFLALCTHSSLYVGALVPSHMLRDCCWKECNQLYGPHKDHDMLHSKFCRGACDLRRAGFDEQHCKNQCDTGVKYCDRGCSLYDECEKIILSKHNEL